MGHLEGSKGTFPFRSFILIILSDKSYKGTKVCRDEVKYSLNYRLNIFVIIE